MRLAPFFAVAVALVAACGRKKFNGTGDGSPVGLMAAPSSAVTGPACVFNSPVSCGVPAFPQVDLAWLANNNASDSS